MKENKELRGYMSYITQNGCNLLKTAPFADFIGILELLQLGRNIVTISYFWCFISIKVTTMDRLV